MGLRGSVQNALLLRGAPVGPEQMLGEAGQGMIAADDAFTFGRIYIAAACLGVMKRCAQLGHRYADRRMVATGKLIEAPGILIALGGLVHRIRAVAALLQRIGEDLDAGATLPAELPMAAKVAASDFASEAADDLVQTLGGRGYMENNLAPQILRDARALRIGEGPNETLTWSLGRSIHQTDAIARYLSGPLHAGDLADQLDSAAREALSRCEGQEGRFPSRSAARAWAFTLAGHATVDALLLASARLVTTKSSEMATVDWLKRRFEAALKRASHGDHAEAAILDPRDAKDVMAEYARAIGDVEQTLPGTDELVDPIFRRSTVAAPATDDDLPGQCPDESAQPAAGDYYSSLGPTAKRALLEQLLRRVNGAVSPDHS
jgi:hypothetical protein